MTTKQREAQLTVGTEYTCTIERAAHGGEGIALIDGCVVFLPNTYPGDTVRAKIEHVKKNFARASVVEILTPSQHRVAQRCAAAAHGAGCCDYGDYDPAHEVELKSAILSGQLSRLGKLPDHPSIEALEMPPHTKWRTRMRLGIDASGRAGMRTAHAHTIVTGHPCIQAVDGLLDGIVGRDAQRFTPFAELVVVLDDAGNRHVVEVQRAARGKRSEKTLKVLEGTGTITQTVGGYRFELPATAFWQAHVQAIPTYSEIIRQWATRASSAQTTPVAWDLYGGVGAFAPALMDALGKDVQIHSVELSAQAAKAGKQAFQQAVKFHTGKVEDIVATLPTPDVVVLDPPRVGAGHKVVQAIAAAGPRMIIHIGCDPATFARDIRSFAEAGYTLSEIKLCNAFPGTHHFETIGLLQR